LPSQQQYQSVAGQQQPHQYMQHPFSQQRLPQYQHQHQDQIAELSAGKAVTSQATSVSHDPNSQFMEGIDALASELLSDTSLTAPLPNFSNFPPPNDHWSFIQGDTQRKSSMELQAMLAAVNAAPPVSAQEDLSSLLWQYATEGLADDIIHLPNSTTE
jgi:hypothetical protein